MAFYHAKNSFHFVHTMNKPLQEFCDAGFALGGKPAEKTKD
jgi:hypothetical protein